MEISGLYIYPIKSLQGLSVSSAEVMEKGFKYDRRWMLVDANNGHVTQRTHPHLSQIGLEMSANAIILSHKNKSDLEIPLTLVDGNQVEVTIWNDTVQAIEAPEQINSWISDVARDPCRLVYMPEDANRPINPERARNNEQVSFADGYPYLILGQSSLDDLNSKMEVDLPMHRFRPNIVVTGSEPYEEDHWKDLQIGDVSFYGTNPCKRCVFTTIDQETGEKGIEPLKTLATYRREGKDVIFGLNTVAASTGLIHVGDSMWVE
ncbi:MAG: MOSC domain-containing protein [Cyclobacteriaceae bacterium]